MRGEPGKRADGLFLFAALVLIAMGVGYWYINAPTWLKVAVGPAGSPDETLLQVFAGQLKAQRVGVRLKVVSVPDVKAAADALDKGDVDLAVVRPDVKVPDNGLTLAILRDAAAIVVVPSASGIGDMAGLAGKTLGVATRHAADPAFFATILKQLDIETPAVSVVPVALDAALAELQAGRVDAVAFLGPPTGTVSSDFVRSVARAYEGRINILTMESPDAISQRSPVFSIATIPEAVWGGRPKLPERETKTVSVSYRLMAHSDTDRSAVSVLIEALFQSRSRLAVKARSANFMRAPEMETASSATSAILPNHPGAVDYFQRETQSVMDRYGDWIYLGAFFGSGVISGLAWLVQRFRRHRREMIDDVLDRLLGILKDAREAVDLETLDRLTDEVDGLLRVAVEHARSGATGSHATSALMLALEGSRSAIEDRRRTILAHDPRRREGPPRLVTVS